ncbi:hypothetical protein WR25_06251 isoform B [Diploscapter pachys]|uniref:Protein Wnt n=1 Tax=Diploscapter pachys TaxID=2018661 RepID=A0A2A2LX42_9BILA|nr:hypothetical protein WR25_06251 isoform B [Diploscapter pachys]
MEILLLQFLGVFKYFDLEEFYLQLLEIWQSYEHLITSLEQIIGGADRFTRLCANAYKDSRLISKLYANSTQLQYPSSPKASEKLYFNVSNSFNLIDGIALLGMKLLKALMVRFKIFLDELFDRVSLNINIHRKIKKELPNKERWKNSATREAAYLAAISSASIVHSITKGCTTGNLTECGCDSKPNLQRYAIEEDILGGQRRQRANSEQFSWGGCSDNVPYGVKFSRKFLDEWEQEQFNKTKDVSHLVRKHNHFVGREAIAQNVRKQCRCHGVSGSCEFRTCWLQMPKFVEVAEMLKKRYEHFAVQVTKRAKKRLRRKDRAERGTPLRGNEMAYVQRSPSYCERNDTIGLFLEMNK